MVGAAVPVSPVHVSSLQRLEELDAGIRPLQYNTS